MKYIKFIFVLNLLILMPGIFIAQNANVTCIYRETIRKDVTQPVHTRAIPYSNATDIDCCLNNDYICQQRLKRSAQEYCNRPNRVPKGYTFSSAKVMCGKGFVGDDGGVEYTNGE